MLVLLSKITETLPEKKVNVLKQSHLRFDDFLCYFFRGCVDRGYINSVNVMLNENHEILQIGMIMKIENLMQFEK